MYYGHVLYKAADYLRLSKEDGDFSVSPGKLESNSISSQRDLIRRYVSKCPDIELVAEYVDDGFTGTNFDRPNFQRMMQAVEKGEINCIIVKDLSRFGREYIDAGQYIEKVFPQKGIRFIAINDNYDSLTSTQASDSLIIPFKNLINDSYSRDISIKIRTNLDAKRRRGEFIANYPVYGYTRDPDDKNHLVIDEDAAAVVRNIFEWKIEGFSPEAIAKKLNESGILSPAAYKRAHGSRYATSFQTNKSASWSGVTVTRILTNEVYCGVLIQGRRTTANYKVKKVVVKPEQDWVRIEGAHDPIINCNQFHVIQRLMGEDNRAIGGSERTRPLSGRVYCGCCGSPAKRRVVSNGGKQYVYYRCPNSRKDGGCKPCTIPEAKLEETVLDTLKLQISAILDLDRALREIDALTWEKKELRRLDAGIAEQEEQIRRNSELKLSAYEDFKAGLFDREELGRIKEELTQRIERAQKALDSLRSRRAEVAEGASGQQGWLAQFRDYGNISELTRAIVVTMIDRVLLFPNKQIQIELRHKDQIGHAAEFLRTQNAQSSERMKAVI